MKKLFVISAAMALMLVGCGKVKPAEISSAEQTIDPTSVESVESVESIEEPTGMTPEEVVTEIGSYWGGTPTEVKTGVFGVYGAFAAANYSVEDMKNYVSTLFVPEEFELVEDWTAMEDGTESCFYMNAVNTGLKVYVYADTFIVDSEGKVVQESAEGTTDVDVTCIEAYAYTVSLD